MSDVSPFLTDGTVIELLVRLILGALASFVAIVSWTRTRSPSWIFVVVGVLALYAGTLYRALRSFGLFSLSDVFIGGASLGTLISDNLSLLFFIVGCVVHIRWRK